MIRYRSSGSVDGRLAAARPSRNASYARNAQSYGRRWDRSERHGRRGPRYAGQKRPMAPSRQTPAPAHSLKPPRTLLHTWQRQFGYVRQSIDWDMFGRFQAISPCSLAGLPKSTLLPLFSEPVILNLALHSSFDRVVAAVLYTDEGTLAARGRVS